MSPQTLSPVHVEMKEYDVSRTGDDVSRTGDDVSRTQGAAADAAGGVRENHLHSRAVTRPLCLTPPQPSVHVVSGVRVARHTLLTLLLLSAMRTQL
jgi:hypothetical protein